MKKRALAIFLSLSLAIGGLFVSPGPAVAAGEADYLAAALLLSKYKLVQGDERGLRLGDPISRGEMAKLLVHALAVESQVGDYRDRNDFTDTRGHWAEGHISLAKRLGLLRGYPTGEFRPNAQISHAEVITVLARLVGVEGTKDPWPFNYIEVARTTGILPPEGLETMKDLYAPATRGDVFILLKRTVADVKNFAGKTLAQTYLDSIPPVITVDPQPKETSDVQLAVSGSVNEGQLVRVNGTPVKVEFGVFQHTVSLRLGPNTIRVQAFDEAGNMSEKSVLVTRVAGSATSVELSGPASVAAGGSVQFKLAVRDRHGEELPRSQAEVIIAPEMGRFDLNTGRFTAGAKTGRVTITVMAGSASASAAVEITSGGLDKLSVFPPEVQLGPGQSHSFVATGTDAQGNPVPVSGVTWSATGGTITQNGEFTGATTSGSVTVTATAGGRSATATVRPLNFRVATVQVTPPQGVTIRANGKSEVTVTATLRDAQGAVVTDYAGTVSVTSSAPGTLNPTQPDWQVVDGVATMTLKTGARAGTAAISVKTNLGRTGSANVTVTPQQIQTVRLTGTQLPSTDGNRRGMVEALALDQDGNPLLTPLNQTLVVRLTIAPAQATFVSNGLSVADLAMGALDPATQDVRARAEILYTPQSGTLTVSGQVQTQNLTYVGVLAGALYAGPAGPPAQVRLDPIPETVAGQTRSVVVSIVDKDGFGVAAVPAGYAVVLRDQFGTTWQPNACPVGGCVPVWQRTFDVMQTKAGSYTYTATLLPGGHSTTFTTAVVPDQVASVTLSASPNSIPADNATQSTLKAELFDGFGNKVTAGSYPITFSKSINQGATQTFVTRVVASAGGEAAVAVTAGTLAATDTYQVSVPGPTPPNLPPQAPFTATVALTTLGATAHRVALSYPDANANVGTAGLPITIQAAVVDAAGTVLTYDSGRTITLTVRNMSTLKESSHTATTSNGIATFKVTRSDTGTMSVKAETGSLIKGLSAGYGGTASDLVIQPGVSTQLKVTADLSSIKSDGGKSFSLISVHLLDPNGNVTTNQTGVPINVTLSLSPSQRTFGYFTADDTAGGFAISTKTVSIAPGASTGPQVKLFSTATAGTTTIQASTLDGGSAQITVATTAIGAVSTLVVDTIAAVPMEPYANADGVVSGQTITVTAFDSSGRRVTDFGANGETITLTAEGDARVVAYWDGNLRTWRTTDSALGNGVGDYTASAAVAANRGQAVFRVRAASAGTKVYRIGYGSNTALVSATGDFTPSAADHLTVQVARRQVTGGGDQVAIQARVRDVYGNTLSNITGPIQFRVAAGGASGQLLNTSAELVGGVATAYFQSGLNVAADTVVIVHAFSTALWPAGNNVVGGSAANPAIDQFTVDGTPALTALAVTNNGTTPGANQGDRIAFTFSEAIDAAVIPSSMAGLKVQFDATTSLIAFTGLPGLGTVYLWPGALTADSTFAVSAISVAGTVVTVTLGVKEAGTATTQFDRTSGTAATVSMNGSIRNLTGSGAFGPFSVTVTGNF